MLSSKRLTLFPFIGVARRHEKTARWFEAIPGRGRGTFVTHVKTAPFFESQKKGKLEFFRCCRIKIL